MSDHRPDATKLMPDLARLRELLAGIQRHDPLPWSESELGSLCDANGKRVWITGPTEIFPLLNALPAMLDVAEAWQKHTTQLHTLIGCGNCGCGVRPSEAVMIEGKPSCLGCAQGWVFARETEPLLDCDTCSETAVAKTLAADNAALRECLREIVEHSRNGMTHAEWMEWGRLHGRPNTVALALRAAELCGLTGDAGNHPVAPDSSMEVQP